MVGNFCGNDALAAVSSAGSLIRIIYITTMVKIIPDIRVVFSAYPVTWTISTIIFAYFLMKGDWLKKKAL